MDAILAGSFRAAIYCRLSKDDDLDGESASIANQRDMLENYCEKQGWEVVAVYQDDGYTGLNMERPDLKRMLKAIERRQANLVITKDLSRLGRNYLQTGFLIEDFFPRHGVRYIAMNDGIDTMRDNNDIAPFKNILNEMYSKDISKKVHSSYLLKAQKGQFTGCLAPFGYQKDPEDKNHLLIDEETFELAQKRIATRHRPTKAAEIDIFSGLLFCAGCRHKMYYQQGVNIEPRKFSYSCGAWRNRARTGSECTSHYIRKNVLLDLVLEDMRRVLRYVKEHEQDFICKATEYGDMEARKALAQQQKELFKAQARMTELDTLFRKLYEDNALGRLTDERFVFLTSGYEDEKKSLAARIDELQQQIATVTERKRDISRFIQIVGKYSDIQELTYENVHEFIDRILIHELDRETNTRKIEIHYSFVGQVDTEQEPTQVVNHDRRNMVDVKSIAI